MKASALLGLIAFGICICSGSLHPESAIAAWENVNFYSATSPDQALREGVLPLYSDRLLPRTQNSARCRRLRSMPWLDKGDCKGRELYASSIDFTLKVN